MVLRLPQQSPWVQLKRRALFKFKKLLSQNRCTNFSGVVKKNGPDFYDNHHLFI